MTGKVISRAAPAFLAVVERITLAGRQPTTWEAGWLFAALCALFQGDEAEAEYRISMASMAGIYIYGDPPVTVVPTLTAQELVEALQRVTAEPRSPVQPSASNPQ